MVLFLSINKVSGSAIHMHRMYWQAKYCQNIYSCKFIHQLLAIHNKSGCSLFRQLV